MPFPSRRASGCPSEWRGAFHPRPGVSGGECSSEGVPTPIYTFYITFLLRSFPGVLLQLQAERPSPFKSREQAPLPLNFTFQPESFPFVEKRQSLSNKFTFPGSLKRERRVSVERLGRWDVMMVARKEVEARTQELTPVSEEAMRNRATPGTTP